MADRASLKKAAEPAANAGAEPHDGQPFSPDRCSNSDGASSSSMQGGEHSRDAWGREQQQFDWLRMCADSDQPTAAQDSTRIAVEDLGQASKRLSAELLRQLQEGVEQDSAAPSPPRQRKSAGSDRGRGRSSRGSSAGSGRSGRVTERISPAHLEQPAQARQKSGSHSYRDQLAAAFVADTLRALPCRAEAVSHMRGPVLQMNCVDQTSVDVRIFHSFRAHFAAHELQQALSRDKDGLMGLSQPEEMSALLEEMTLSASDQTDRSASNMSAQESLGQRTASRAASGELPPELSIGQRCSQGAVRSFSSSHKHHSAPGDPASWLHRSGLPRNTNEFPRNAGASASSRRRHRHTASPLTSPHNSLSGPPYRSSHMGGGSPSGRRPSPQEMADLTPFAAAEVRSVPLSPQPSAGLHRRRKTSDEASEGACSGDPFSLDALPSDSTGGMTASQDGMRSPIVQDMVVDAVQEAHSKLANLTTEMPVGTVPNSLASYDQTHIRRPMLTQAQTIALGSWEIDPNSVIIGERIAMGGFAEVFIGKFEGTVVAIKLLLMFDEITTDKVLKEVAALAQLRHPNLILFMGFCLQPRPAIVCEFMQRGSLFKVLRKQNGPLDGKLVRAIAIAVTRGMAYLHGRSPAMLHLDLKSPNILLDDRWHCKIADFGLSQTRERTLLSRGAAGGTPEWMAPEMLRCEPFDERADVYSFGVCLWECLTGDVPWAGLHAMQVVGAVGFQRKSLPRPQHSEKFLVDLCVRCMDQDPHTRPLFPAIVRDLEQEFAPPKLMSLSTSLSEAARKELVRGSGALGSGPSQEPAAHRMFQPGYQPSPGKRW